MYRPSIPYARRPANRKLLDLLFALCTEYIYIYISQGSRIGVATHRLTSPPRLATIGGGATTVSWHGPSTTNHLTWLCALCFVWGQIYRPSIPCCHTAGQPHILIAPSFFFPNDLQAKSGFEMCFDIGSQHFGCWGQNTSPYAQGCDPS